MGSLNKRSREKAEAIEASGMDPLDYMIAVMRDQEQTVAVRLDAAKGAAPFVHAKLIAQETAVTPPEEEDYLLEELERTLAIDPAFAEKPELVSDILAAVRGAKE